MKRTHYGCCSPKKKECRRSSPNKKLGLAMLLLECWVILLCATIIVCGILLLRG